MMARILLAVLWVSLVCTGAAGVETSYARWRIDDAKRLDSGAVEQRLTLLPPVVGSRPESVEFVVRQSTLPAFDKKPVDEQTVWKRGPLAADADGAYPLAVEAHRYCRTTVWAKFVINNGVFWAQTAFNQYGKSDQLNSENNPPMQAPPAFNLSSSGEDYWPQTGHVFTLAPQWDGAEALGCLVVAGESGEVLARPEIRDGVASYQPPHDPELDRAGDFAKKQFIFIADNSLGGTNTFTLAVHRSRSGNMHLAAGLWYGGAVAALSLIVAVRLRRGGGR